MVSAVKLFSMCAGSALLTLFIVGENGHVCFNCDLHGVLKFSQVVGVVPWYLPLRFGRGQKYPPVEICGGAHSPLELQISLTNRISVNS